MKKLISLALAVTMLFALIPFSVSAETDSQGLSYTLSDDGTYYIVSDFDDSVTNVVIPEEYNGLPVITIGEWAFWRSNLANIELSNSVTTIDAAAFVGCSNLTNIEIPDSVTTIGESAFTGCINLTNIEIPDSVITIGESAFQGCTSLTNIEIPNSVTTIGATAFYLCENLTEIVIPDSVTTINPVTFRDCHSLTSIIIPDSVTAIGGSAFYGCLNLTNITIPNSVMTIGSGAFVNCDSFTNIVIPDSVTEIAADAFSSCNNLTSIIIPDSVTVMGYDVFWGCDNLTDIYCEAESLPEGWAGGYSENDEGHWLGVGQDTCTATVHWGYNGDTTNSQGLSYTLSDDGTYYIVSGFDNSISEVVIPSEYNNLPIKEIGERAFVGCSGLTSITISDSVTKIDYFAFEECMSLTSIAIPDSVTTIANYAFVGCPAIETIEVSSGNKVYHSDGNCLIKTETNTLVKGCKNSIIPNYVEIIGESAFEDCTGLTYIEIPDSVTTIFRSFAECYDLTSIVIPSSVITMGDCVFDACIALTDIYCEAETQPEGWDENWNSGCEATVHWGYTDKANEALNAAIAAIEKLNESDYTSEQWSAIQTALAAAKNYNTEGKTASEIRAVISELNKAVDSATVTLGDVNGDGAIDQFDYILVKRDYFETYELSEEEAKRSDVDGNGAVDQFDYVLIKRIYFGTYSIDA